MATKLCFFVLCIEIMTSTVDIKDGSRGRPVQKPKVVFFNFFFSLIVMDSWGQFDFFFFGLIDRNHAWEVREV